LGLNSLADLPALADFVPEASIVEALERGLLLSPVDAVMPESADDTDDTDDTDDADGSPAPTIER
jgi:hypothetical protein